MHYVLVTFLLLRNNTPHLQFKRGKYYIDSHLRHVSPYMVSQLQSRTAGAWLRRAARDTGMREQRDIEGGAKKGANPFQVTPAVTYLAWPDPTSSKQVNCDISIILLPFKSHTSELMRHWETSKHDPQHISNLPCSKSNSVLTQVAIALIFSNLCQWLSSLRFWNFIMTWLDDHLLEYSFLVFGTSLWCKDTSL